MRRAALMLMPLLVCSGALAAPIGNATAVRPQASVETLSGTTMLAVGGGVEANNRVVTGEAGSTRLKFLDASTLDVGSNAAVTLDEFVYAGDKASKAALTMTKGAFRWVSGKSPKEAYDLKTPLASIGIRGTDFRVETDEKRTTIRLSSGAVHACNRVSNVCATIDRPGQGVHLDADGKVEMFEERQQITPPMIRRASGPPPTSYGPPARRASATAPRRYNTYEPPRRVRRPVYEPEYVDDMPPPYRPPMIVVDPVRPQPPRLCGYPLVPRPDGRGCMRPPNTRPCGFAGCTPPRPPNTRPCGFAGCDTRPPIIVDPYRPQRPQRPRDGMNRGGRLGFNEGGGLGGRRFSFGGL